MTEHNLSICVVSHKQSHLVLQLLESLEKTKPDFSFQVIVLENIKGQPTIPNAQFDFNIVYLQNADQLSLSANINKVFELVQDETEFFCILNPDIVFKEEIFVDLFAAMDKHQVDIISPLIIDSEGAIQDSFRPIPTPKEIVLRYLGLSKTVYRFDDLPLISHPDWIGAMFMLMPAAVFKGVGGFDPNYSLYFEDVDFCLRARSAGYSIGVYKESQLIHDAQRSSRKEIKYLLKHLNSARIFFKSELYAMYR
jgi:GT2 family glycosyltransferase